MRKVYCYGEGGWLQIPIRRINFTLLGAAGLILISLITLPFRNLLGLSFTLLTISFLILVAYIFVESNEIGDLEKFLKNLIEKKEIKNFEGDSKIFEEVRIFLKTLGESYLKGESDLRNIRTICNEISSKVDEAIIIINAEGEIVFKNKEAENLIKLKDKKLYYEAIRNSTIITIIGNALKENKTIEQNVEINGVLYNATLSPVTLYDREHILAIFKKLEDFRNETFLKSQFLEAVSHEMKTPLSSILGTVEILENENFVKKKGLQFLTILKENTERLKKLTERILKLSEIESVRNSLKEIVYLTKLGEEVVKKFENQFKEKGLEFTYEIQENTKIKGNYFLLEDVLINLLENAMKYTESGRVSLKIFKDEKYAYVEVEDTGKGIREENIDKIFEPFYREDRSRNENVKGTGLGLTITKRIVDIHSGEIKVESKPGAGTKFTLKFPKVD